MSDIYVQYEATVSVTHSVWRIIVKVPRGKIDQYRIDHDDQSSDDLSPPEPMKPSSPPEPLYTFTYPKLGYSIQIVPHTSADRAKIKRDAKSRHVSLRDYCQDEIIGSMVLAEFE